MFKKFTTKDIVVIATLIAISGAAQMLWSHLVFQLGVLGPARVIFTNAGFMVWAFIALYLVPKPGVATIVKGLGAVIEVILGNPFGPIAILYGILEGLAVDTAFLLFKGNLSVIMMIIGAALSQLYTAPVDFIRDAVPWNLIAILTYWSPGMAGTAMTGFLSYIVLNILKKIGIRPNKK